MSFFYNSFSYFEKARDNLICTWLNRFGNTSLMKIDEYVIYEDVKIIILLILQLAMTNIILTLSTSITKMLNYIFYFHITILI